MLAASVLTSARCEHPSPVGTYLLLLLSVTAIACARYVCQVSVRADFFGTAPSVLETIISSGTAITYNKTLGEPCWQR
jgi:hypothetical protein